MSGDPASEIAALANGRGLDLSHSSENSFMETYSEEHFSDMGTKDAVIGQSKIT